jgi:GNAT superfamily N-acetyltransferase
VYRIDVADGEDGVEACLAVAHGVDEGFNEQGLATMADDLPGQRTLLALDDDEVVGFASVAATGERVRELAWLAVTQSRQRAGIGRRLVEALVEDCRESGVELLSVKTLAGTVESAHYDGVRQFYRDLGFRHVETIDPYPPWGEGNPCAIYVRPLGRAVDD